MVVLSGAAFRAYQQQLRRRERHGGGGGMGLREGVMVLHVGDHVIKEPHGGAAAGESGRVHGYGSQWLRQGRRPLGLARGQ